jgi:Spy/CpxP family protein refolding chaperone
MGAAIAAPQDASQTAPAGPVEQQRGHQAPDPNRQAQMLAKRLNLTTDQQQQLLPILTSRDQQVAALRSDNSLSREDRHAKMKSIRESTDSQIRALLNDQQKQAYDQMQQNMRERSRQRQDNKANNPA